VIGDGVACENTWHNGNIVTCYYEPLRETSHISYMNHPNLFYPDMICSEYCSLPDYYNILVQHPITKNLPSSIAATGPYCDPDSGWHM